jgi:2-polyprenyl-6-methoxyphenol hydroxylase-like FAD-dependent oxidoreductase
MKRHDPSHDVVVYERGPRDATWGFGVVFSDRALEFLRADDEDLVRPADAAHGDLARPDHRAQRHPHSDRGQRLRGDRAARDARACCMPMPSRLGVRIVFQTDDQLAVAGPSWPDADLVVAANGAFSWVRAENEHQFRHPRIDWRPNQLHLVRARASRSTACH